jgi:enoyl-CoA hydratase/carnithine racemase
MEFLMDDIVVERSNGVVRAILNRPAKKNALTLEMFRSLGELFQEVDENRDDRVLVLTGESGNFSTGFDLDDAQTLVELESGLRDEIDRINESAVALFQLRKPTIAAVDGLAVGAGMSLALGCDLVVATSRARFGAVFIHRGLSIDFGLSWLLPRLAGLARAREISLLGQIFDAEAALEWNLVSRVVTPESLQVETSALATSLATSPSAAIAGDTALLNASFQLSFEESIQREAEIQTSNLKTDDVAEAIGAFKNRRTALFKGQ